MKIKTSELAGAQLDWAVCIAEGLKPEDLYVYKGGPKFTRIFRKTRDEDGRLDGYYTTGPDLIFSLKWEAAGPIIAREKLTVTPLFSMEGGWRANHHNLRYDANGEYIHGSDNMQDGPTPLIAAMRCYVASKFGDEFEIPDKGP